LYDIKLTKIGITFEKGIEEPLYHFTDNLGGYTLEGIKASIREKVLEN